MDKLRVFLIIAIIIAMGGLCYATYFLITKNAEEEACRNAVESSVNVAINKIDVTKITAIFTTQDYPKVDGSTATIPLAQAFKRTYTGDQNAEVESSKTHQAYEKLINKEVDLILATYPSNEELELAKSKNIELNIEPVANEAFVFYVNSENKVRNLTQEQIQKIYSGEITNWKELGGDDAAIIAYQRDPNSGSQTGMETIVMKDKKLMDAPVETIAGETEAIVNAVADYENGKYAIGYSYLYYANTMFDTINTSARSRIRFVAIDNIQPNEENTKNGAYPFRTYYYVVTRKDEDKNSNTLKLRDAMLSDEGQAIVRKSGYIPLK